jgi:hypothetical protein
MENRAKTVTTNPNEPPQTCNPLRLNPLATTASTLHIEHHIGKETPHNDLNMTTKKMKTINQAVADTLLLEVFNLICA